MKVYIVRDSEGNEILGVYRHYEDAKQFIAARGYPADIIKMEVLEYYEN